MLKNDLHPTVQLRPVVGQIELPLLLQTLIEVELKLRAMFVMVRTMEEWIPVHLKADQNLQRLILDQLLETPKAAQLVVTQEWETVLQVGQSQIHQSLKQERIELHPLLQIEELILLNPLIEVRTGQVLASQNQALQSQGHPSPSEARTVELGSKKPH